MKLTNYERETIITFNEAEQTANVYTCNKALIHKLDGFCKNHSVIIRVQEDEFSKTYKLPKKLISIRQPRYLPDETRQKMKDMASANFHNSSKEEQQ